jgi:hypothetical protein
VNDSVHAATAGVIQWTGYERRMREDVACPDCDQPRALPNPNCEVHPTS